MEQMLAPMSSDRSNRIETLSPADAAPNVVLPYTNRSTDSTWFARYLKAIQGLPQTTRNVVEADATFIANKAFPTTLNGQLDESTYNSSRVRTGIVVGSVQSGKTASMLAVAALLLDRKIDLLIVLAGTRVALWLQTYERLLQQLDGSNLINSWERNSLRALVPQPEDILAAGDRVDPISYLRGARNKVRTAMNNGRPSIFVVPKEDDHLLALGRFLTEQVELNYSESRDDPILMAVLDDEADDASVLDSENSGKITPKFIQQLWSSMATAPQTIHPRLFATYIAYTATPQANYLQRSHNPLAPRDFHAALRVPGDSGHLNPRSVTYTEEVGLNSFYTGGDFYYERFRGLPADPCVSYPFPQIDEDENDDEVQRNKYESTRWQMLGDAMRCYLVAGAIRMIDSGKRFPPPNASSMSRRDLATILPPTHSMLYHPSALKDDQFAGAADIVRWSSGAHMQSALKIDQPEAYEYQLDVKGIEARINAEENLWSGWLEKFQSAATGLSTVPGATHSSLNRLHWADVKHALLCDVLPFVNIRVLNSDPRAGERPEFYPRMCANGSWVMPRDIYTIFIAGNVLSRGLTVEGLCTSLFLRSSKEPAADTQMQMQRWFGYRGAHFEFCKVFAFADQLQLFREYHSNDQAMKSEILSHMEQAAHPFGSGALILQGDAFKATSKVESKKVPLHPGPTPSIKLVERSSGSRYEQNVRVLSDLMNKGEWQHLNYPGDTERGLIQTTPITMIEVALILESLRYSTHDPSPSLELSKRWQSLQRLLNSDSPLFRPPGDNPSDMAVDPSGCPYSIAAYLRFWDGALKHPKTPGLRPTDNPSLPWNMLNSKSYRETAPKFYVGVRFGSGNRTTSITFKDNPFPMMQRGFSGNREDLLATLWGSRNPTERWFGDQVFDYHYHNASGAPRLLSDGAWRPRGHPGLLLFHPVADPNDNRELIALGLAIPHGGPDHVAALRGSDDER